MAYAMKLSELTKLKGKTGAAAAAAAGSALNCAPIFKMLGDELPKNADVVKKVQGVYQWVILDASGNVRLPTGFFFSAIFTGAERIGGWRIRHRSEERCWISERRPGGEGGLHDHHQGRRLRRSLLRQGKCPTIFHAGATADIPCFFFSLLCVFISSFWKAL